MKKSVVPITLVVLFACAAVASAQTTGGVKAGVNFANVSISGGGVSVSPANRTGWLVGAFVEVPIVPHVIFQPEFLYSSKGSTAPAELVGEAGVGDITLKLDYIDVPLLVRFNAPMQNSKVVPFVYAGPDIAFLARANATGTPTGGTETSVDIKSEFKTTDFGVGFGGGVQVGRVIVDARYVIGLTNTLSSANSTSGETMKNKVFSVMVGYRF